MNTMSAGLTEVICECDDCKQAETPCNWASNCLDHEGEICQGCREMQEAHKDMLFDSGVVLGLI